MFQSWYREEKIGEHWGGFAAPVLPNFFPLLVLTRFWANLTLLVSLLKARIMAMRSPAVLVMCRARWPNTHSKGTDLQQGAASRLLQAGPDAG